MNKQERIEKLIDGIKDNLGAVARIMYGNDVVEFINKHLQDYELVPKDTYKAMEGECTLAAIRRGDFV